MSLIIATGSNIGDPLESLREAQQQLAKHFELIQASRVYRSAAVDYEAQPDFYNQVLEFRLPSQGPEEIMRFLLQIEQNMGRIRDIPRGPRRIDIDLILWGTTTLVSEQVVIPHPRFLERSFVIRPLQELPFFKTIEKCFTIPESFKVEAFPV